MTTKDAHDHFSRFMLYSAIGTGTFVLDLLFLLFLTGVLGIDPVPSAGIAFLFAITLNYILSRTYVFAESQKSHLTTYLMFIALGVVGLILVMGLMYVATAILKWNFVTSRVFIAGIVGVLNYLLNLYLNFSISTPTIQKS